MISVQNVKVNGAMLPPTAIATNAAVTGYVDTKGFGYCFIAFTHNTAAATNSSAKFSALAIAQSDSTSVTGTAITGLTGTTNTVATSSAFVLKAHNDTTYAGADVVGIDMRGRSRYIYYTVTSGASNTMVGVTPILIRSENAIDSDTERGAGAGFA